MAMARCLDPDCRQALFETMILDSAGNTALQTAALHHKVEFDGNCGQLFIRCRYCGAKNGLKESLDRRENRTRLVLDRLLD